jgi:hypothetical protein
MKLSVIALQARCEEFGQSPRRARQSIDIHGRLRTKSLGARIQQALLGKPIT